MQKAEGCHATTSSHISHDLPPKAGVWQMATIAKVSPAYMIIALAPLSFGALTLLVGLCSM